MKRFLSTISVIGVLLLTILLIQPKSFATYEPTSVSSLTQLSAPTGLYWDGLSMKWTDMLADVPHLDRYKFKLYFSPDESVDTISEIDILGSYWGLNYANYNSLKQPDVEDYGTGYYYFRVQAVTDDSSVIRSSSWSDLSPAYYYEMPDRLPTPTAPYWDGTYMKWAEFGSMIQGADYSDITLYYLDINSPNAEPAPIFSTGSYGANGQFLPNDLSDQRDLETGYYYFTVQLGAQNILIALDSLVSELSPAYYYEAPEKYPAPDGLYWDNDAFMRWSNMGDPLIDSYVIEVYYGSDDSLEIDSLKKVDTFYNIYSDGRFKWQGLEESSIEDYGEGYYYFRVKGNPSSATGTTSGEWSELSPSFYFDGTIGERLSVPTGLRWDGTKVCWDSMNNANDRHIIYLVQFYFGKHETGLDAYHVSYGGKQYCPAPSLVVDFPFNAKPVNTSTGYYFFRVKALSNNITIATSSDFSTLSPGYYHSGIKTGTCGDDLTWSLDSTTGVLTISGTGAMNDYWGDSPWGTNVKIVRVEEGVTSIGGSAFADCTLLTEVELSAVTTIGYNAFFNCTSLSDVNYGATFTEWMAIDISWGNHALIKAYLFSNNQTITGVCGESLTWTLDGTGMLTISGSGDMYDYDCYDTPWNQYREIIYNVVVTEGVTAIGKSAFWCCESLTSIALPSSLTAIGRFSFSHCTSLESVTIPASVDAIDVRAFSGCDSLTAFSVATGNTAYQVINGVLFSADGKTLIAYPSGSTSVTYSIPNSVVCVEDYAFGHSDNLAEIIIPQSVTSLGEASFSECKSLVTVVLPTSVTAINYATFYNCSNLRDVAIPNTVTSIGVSAFEGCRNLTDVLIPEGVVEIQDSSFFRCSKLNNITLPHTVTAINYSAFANCRSLTTVNIPSGVERIEYNAFSDCKAIESFTVEEDSEHFKSVDDVLLTADGTTLVLYPIGNAKTSYLVPNSVKKINAHAFDSAQNLQTITIPDGVEEIGRYSFLNCTALTSITIPGSVENIDFGAFAMCDALDEVVLENGVSAIESDAFAWCFSLSKVHLPLSMAEIYSDAFNDCESLEKIYYCGTESLWETVFIEQGNDYLINADYIFINPDNLQAALSTQTGELRICGVHEDADTVMIAFYNQNGQLERIEMYTADEVAFGVLISELDSQYVIQVMQINDGFSPVTTTVVP